MTKVILFLPMTGLVLGLLVVGDLLEACPMIGDCVLLGTCRGRGEPGEDREGDGECVDRRGECGGEHDGEGG